MGVSIVRASVSDLGEYARIAIAFEVARVLDVDGDITETGRAF
jgi:hypothetical protein